MTHEEFAHFARENPPPQEWYDEDVNSLRGPIMNCKQCNAEETIKNDRTKLNDYGICRDCQHQKDVPMPWKWGNVYGCYFPSTDLNVSEWGQRGTGKPENVEWLQDQLK